MNPKSIVHFFSTPAGRFTGFILLVFVALGLARGCRRDAPSASKVVEPHTNAPVTVTHTTSVSPIGPAATPVVTNTSTNVITLPPLTRYGNLTSEPEITSNFAPYGSIIDCVLVQGIESGDAETPIIALASEDLCHQGVVIVPKDSTIHGRARPGHSRDRIISEPFWTIVWPTGRQLTVSGIALNQDRLSTGGWGPDDGIAGLKGRLVPSDRWANTKVFASAFLSAAAHAVEERQPTTFGPTVLPHAKNATLEGTSAVLDRYAAQIIQQLDREAFVVKVPARPFYLYVTDVIDLNRSRVGTISSQSSTKSLSSTAQNPFP